ncbi:MAG: class I SAM-dependent rRNA methyltransferase [Desulfovibrionaceae bacterium]
MQSLFLKRQEDRRIRAGHLWVFSNEVDVARSPLNGFAPGEPAILHDWRGTPLGTVYVNPHSLIAARVVSRRAGEALDAALLRSRLERALALRERLFSAPYYRLCHGEGDFLPGLVVDRYGDHLAVQITTAGMEAQKDALVEVLDSLLHPASILLRNTVASRTLEGLPLEQVCALGEAPATLTVPENGAQFTVPYLDGQKTGWFYDQRRNHAEAATHASGQDVLDIFCYAGGFGVTAATQGATSVTFMDASRTALDAAMRNAAANAPNCPATAIEGDALKTLAELRDSGRRFGLICLDPPAFIKRRKDAAQGLAAYRKANALALGLLADGGVLVTCSCSHHLELDALHACMAQAASRRHLHGEILYTGAQGPDHPIHFAMPETAYLKCIIARFFE